jgi:hypothetical protein
MLGRNPDLTGRSTDIWPVVMEAASRNPLLGLGYGGAWGLGNEISAKARVEQAHNGYLGVYLEGGLVGVSLLTMFLLSFCSSIRRAIAHDFDWGVFGISFLLMMLLYNLTESAFFDVYIAAAMVLIPVVISVPSQKQGLVAGQGAKVQLGAHGGTRLPAAFAPVARSAGRTGTRPRQEWIR